MPAVLVPGHAIKETLHDSTNSIVVRAVREADGTPVILKILKEEYPSPSRVARFKREFEVTRNLTFAGVIDVYSVERSGRRWMMCIEEYGGDSLRRLGLAGNLELRDFLQLASSIVGVLDQLARRRVMHKDINPANIVLNPDTGVVKLIISLYEVLDAETDSRREAKLVARADLEEGMKWYFDRGFAAA